MPTVAVAAARLIYSCMSRSIYGNIFNTFCCCSAHTWLPTQTHTGTHTHISLYTFYSFSSDSLPLLPHPPSWSAHAQFYGLSAIVVGFCALRFAVVVAVVVHVIEKHLVIKNVGINPVYIVYTSVHIYSMCRADWAFGSVDQKQQRQLAKVKNRAESAVPGHTAQLPAVCSTFCPVKGQPNESM